MKVELSLRAVDLQNVAGFGEYANLGEDMASKDTQ